MFYEVIQFQEYEVLVDTGRGGKNFEILNYEEASI